MRIYLQGTIIVLWSNSPKPCLEKKATSLAFSLKNTFPSKVIVRNHTGLSKEDFKTAKKIFLGGILIHFEVRERKRKRKMENVTNVTVIKYLVESQFAHMFLKHFDNGNFLMSPEGNINKVMQAEFLKFLKGSFNRKNQL